jgi:hypothetical protein
LDGNPSFPRKDSDPFAPYGPRETSGLKALLDEDSLSIVYVGKTLFDHLIGLRLTSSGNVERGGRQKNYK